MASVNRLTAPQLAALTSANGKRTDFLWVKSVKGLGVRVSNLGGKAFVFRGQFRGSTLRITIGDARSWSIPDAEQRARALQHMIDEGRDPRVVKSETAAVDVAKRKAETSSSVTGRDLWARYMLEGKPKSRDAWKPRYRIDLETAASVGGTPKKRGRGLMKPGHLAPLLALPLSAFAAGVGRDTMDDWFAVERKRGRGLQAKRSAAMFAGFLSWVASCREYRGIVDPACARASQLRNAPTAKRRTDAVEIAQLPAWFTGTDKLVDRTAAAYLQVLLLNGMRREELAGLHWADVDFRWSKLTIADKVDDSRTIPLTPYVAFLLRSLPRTSEFVFATTGKTGRISEPRNAHELVLADASIPHVTIHGLRRTFSLLGEAAGAPAGAIAQIMGHKPSAIAEGYRPRSIDALRPYLALIEAFILKCAEIQFDPAMAAVGGLRAVK